MHGDAVHRIREQRRRRCGVLAKERTPKCPRSVIHENALERAVKIGLVLPRAASHKIIVSAARVSAPAKPRTLVATRATIAFATLGFVDSITMAD